MFFVARPIEIATFPLKDGYTTKLVGAGVIHIPKTNHGKSSRILTKKVTTTTVNPGNRRGFCVRRQKTLDIFGDFTFVFWSSPSCVFIFLHFFNSSFIFSFSLFSLRKNTLGHIDNPLGNDRQTRGE